MKVYILFVAMFLSVVSKGEGKCEGNGKAKLDANNIPYLFYGGKWSPICGHYFWDDQNGAKAFCQELGYTNGRLTRGLHQGLLSSHYSQDAIEVGKCRPGEAISSCTGGHNYYTNTKSCRKSVCQLCKGVKITISCNGHTEGTEKTSCSEDSVVSTSTDSTVTTSKYDTGVECIDTFPDDHQSSKYFLAAFPDNKAYLEHYNKPVSDLWPYCSMNCNELAQSAGGNGCYYQWSDLYCSTTPEVKVMDTCKVACKSCCSDGIKNKGEEGVDCGGPCKPCKTPIDCKWSDWEFGECSKTCGGGKRTNYRKELMHQSNGGKACFGTAWETEDCNTNPCLKYIKIQLQTLCSAKGLDAIKTESECKAAAKELGVAYGNAWNGAQDFPDCIFADDGRWKVYFNKHPTGDTTLKNCKNMHKSCHKYAAICKVE